ncbi:MAG TPA: hydroxyisourate hydrolase, partial [Puia sp.]
MSRITTHVLDQSLGRPAGGVEIVLFLGELEVARGRTNTDGRIGDWPEISGNGVGTLRF